MDEYNKYLKIALSNGIKKDTYRSRVQKLFWTPKEAATIPTFTRKQISEAGNNAKAEYKKIEDERQYNDPNNLYSLNKLHYEEALANGISKSTVDTRVRILGWTVEEAITEPVMKKTNSLKDNYDYYRELAKVNGIKYYTFQQRITRGWTPKEAATIPLKKNGSKKRADDKWMRQAIENGINKRTYCYRVDKFGWTVEEASTIPPLPKGEFLNEETKAKATTSFKEMKRRMINRK